MEKVVKYLNCPPEMAEEMSELKKELLSKPLDVQRYIYHELHNTLNTMYSSLSTFSKEYGKLTTTILHRLIETDEKICLCDNQYTMHFNTRIYFKNKCNRGLTYDKKTKKIKFWFGGNIQNNIYIIREYLREIKCDWFFDMDEYLQKHLTKTLLEGIIKGTITNPEDYTKKYMRQSLKYSFHYKLFIKFLVTENFYFREEEYTIIPDGLQPREGENVSDNYIYCLTSEEKKTYFSSIQGRSMNKSLLILQIRDYTLEPNFALQKIMDGSLSYDYMKTLQDMFKQCVITGDKINLHWSYKRLQEEHLKLTRKITAIKYSYIDNTPLPFFGSFTFPETIKGKLLTSEPDVYIEGDVMHHCVYSNYWNRIKGKSYFVFSITYPERCTLGVCQQWRQKDDQVPVFKLDQVYRKMNSPVNQNTKTLLSNWIETKEMQNFFFMNNNIHEEGDVVSLYELEEQIKCVSLEYEEVPRKAV